jgi:hypothetical protein
MLQDIVLTDEQVNDVCSGKIYNVNLRFEFTDGFHAGCRFIRRVHSMHVADNKMQVADALRQLANEIEGGSGGRFYTNASKK